MSSILKSAAAVVPDLSYAADYQRLYHLAHFCFTAVGHLFSKLPNDREGQRAIVGSLKTALEASEFDYNITKGFVTDVLQCPDEGLRTNWTGSAKDVAWLMSHESLSNFFPQFAIQCWKTTPYLIHHVPKTAGTSLNSLTFQNGYFVAYPQTSFKTMSATSGLLGFAIQVRVFENMKHRDRIYIGGHYNLPDMVARLGVMGRCKGVTLTRPPLAILSSAVRFIWSSIEQGSANEKAAHPELQPEHLTALRELLTGFDVQWKQIDDSIKLIVELPEFRANYDEVFTRYFYNSQVTDPIALQQFLRNCGDLFPCTDIEHDRAQVFHHLGITGELPRENISLLSHQELIRAVGGEAQFRTLTATKMEKSEKIYDALVELRNQSAP